LSEEHQGENSGKESEYVISLKGNQGTIHNDVKEFFEQPFDDKCCEQYHIQYVQCECEIGHGRIEKRACCLCTNIDWLPQKAEWRNLHAVGMLTSKRIDKKTGDTSVERRYFLTSLTDAAKAAYAMRAHWSVENNLHWVLDTVFNEDYCLVRKDNVAANLNILRKMRFFLCIPGGDYCLPALSLFISLLM
jgi:transposase, is4 family protein